LDQFLFVPAENVNAELTTTGSRLPRKEADLVFDETITTLKILSAVGKK